MGNKPGSVRGQYKVKDTKKCPCCEEEKNRSEFYTRGGLITKAGRPVLAGQCKECHRSRQRAYESDNYENKRAKNLMVNYGITPEQYNQLLETQDGRCAICKTSERKTHSKTGKEFSLAVDHCHETGKVRGLLCDSCNRAIGLLGDNVDRLQKAIEYLKGSDWS